MQSPDAKLLNELDEIAARCEGTPTSLSSVDDEEFDYLKTYIGYDLQYTSEKRESSSEVLASIPGFDSFKKTSQHLDVKLWLREDSFMERSVIDADRISRQDKKAVTCGVGKDLNRKFSDCLSEIPVFHVKAGEVENIEVVKTDTRQLATPAIFPPEQNLSCTDTTSYSGKSFSASSDLALTVAPEQGGMLPVEDIMEENELNFGKDDYNIINYLLEETKVVEREALEQHIACDRKRMDLKEKREYQATQERLRYLNMIRSAQIIQKLIKTHTERKERKRLNEYKCAVKKISVMYDKIVLSINFQTWLSHYHDFSFACKVVQRVVRSYVQRREANRQVFTFKIKNVMKRFKLRSCYSKWKNFHLLSIKKEKDSSAIVIQCALRKYKAKVILYDNRSAAITIECFLRKESAKMRYRNAQNVKRKDYCSIVIQRTYRGHRLRKRMCGARCYDYSYVDLELEQILGSGAEALLGDILADEPSSWMPELPRSKPHEVCENKATARDVIKTTFEKKANISRNTSICSNQRNVDTMSTLEKTSSNTHNKKNRYDYCQEDKGAPQSNTLMKEWNLNDKRVVQVNIIGAIYFTVASFSSYEVLIDDCLLSPC